MYASVRFLRIENDRPITRENDLGFYFKLQQSILLSLMDEGKLTRTQFHCASDILAQQHGIFDRRKQGTGENS